ncbi:DUF917 domain-containing protein [Streptomyces coffeae]|uniref:DUF917 domain-containing protein n=1 Tax=Streptomyces coffeae TaxID=621382 RepID=A0ABS1NNA9_9ACTN|nr:DUF917 domain-containing protein [Streptomyces coffeae]MBL1101488.1 DUF917 domain-containing protein [Streptomyces coffeae]
MKTLSLVDVGALERGFALLGAGGAGETGTCALILRHQLEQEGLNLLQPAELPPDSWVVPVAYIGTPSVLDEKPPSGKEFTAAVRGVAQWSERQPVAVMPAEGAGQNGIMAMIAAVNLGLPLVDADLCGRALPRLDQVASSIAGEPLVPLALADPGGRLMVLDDADAPAIEAIVRAAIPASGGWAAMAFPPLPAGRLPEVGVVGTVRRALGLGHAHAAAALGSAQDLAESLEACLLGQGRVLEVVREGRAGGFGRGSVSLVDAVSGSLVRVEMENEYLLVLRDGAVVATTPDIICLVDARTGEPITCDRVRGALDVAVIQLAAAPFWMHNGRLEHVGPRAFGFPHDPVLLQEAR